jgi:ABC-type Fe3+-hydroxamate transport system substrate-binding protein
VKDDVGFVLPLAAAPRRVVSLVPSLTEAVAVTAPELLVGVTDFCTHPRSLGRPTVGGSKYPSVERILALAPDLVLANVEENRLEDVAALRSAGIAVWVTYPRTVAQALRSLRRMFAALQVPAPDWLATARSAWDGLAVRPVRRAVIPVWRRPWVVLGSDTFAGDVLRRLGIENVYARAGQRYPRPSLADITSLRPDLVVLPDEPYRFTTTDGPEAFTAIPYALVSGRHLTWYGPSLVSAPTVLTEQLG